MTWAFFLRPVTSDYTYERSETVEVVATRPVESRLGGHLVLLTFEFENGRRDMMTLPHVEKLKTGYTIQVDVLTLDGKKNRYRLADNSIRP